MKAKLQKNFILQFKSAFEARKLWPTMALCKQHLILFFSWPQREEGQIVHKWVLPAKLHLPIKVTLMPACLQQWQWMQAPLKPSSVCLPCLSTQAALHGGSLSKLQGCSNKAEVSELKQTSPHTSMLSKPPASAWGRDQHTGGVLTIPCFILLHYMEPESKWWEAEQLVSTLECLWVNSERFLVSWCFYQEVGQLEKVLEQIHSNQNSCAPEDVKSSYNHLWNQRLASLLSGKLLSPDGGGKQGTEPD